MAASVVPVTGPMVKMVNGEFRPAKSEGKFLLRNPTARSGHYMVGSECIELLPGKYAILDSLPPIRSVEIQYSAL